MAVKTTAYDARIEADGLEALRAAGAPVPAVYEATRDTIRMEWLQGGHADWERLGRTLAAVHRSGASCWRRNGTSSSSSP